MKLLKKFNDERQKIMESDPFFRSLENCRNAEQEAIEQFKRTEKNIIKRNF